MNCPNCKNDEVDLFHNKVWSIDNGKVYQCKKCELIFIHPMMTQEEEKSFYENYNKHVKDRGLTIENSTNEFHEKSKIIASERISIVNDYFINKKVLEIGSSTGAFLSLIKGCHTFACELAHDNREYSKQFITGKAYESLENIQEKDFDIVCMFHVFEHIRNPISFLKTCTSLLNKDGYLIIEVPHSNDPLISLYNCEAFKDFVFQPMHPMVYNEKSLDYVFNQVDLKKVKTIYHQRYGLENHLSWFKNKKAGGDLELAKLFSNNLEYRNTLERIKKTDTIFYIAQKK